MASCHSPIWAINVTKVLALFVFVTGCYPLLVSGTIYRIPPALETNIVAADGMVAFVQGTGGLTVLDAHSGQVKLRKTLPEEVGYPEKLLASPASGFHFARRLQIEP